ncbi:MAG: V-type ATPase 116kDa subunit family protein [Pirellulaceae bacterium]
MFKPEPMVQVNALILKRDERVVLDRLGRAGVMHLSRTEAGPGTAPLDPPDKGPDLARCGALLQRLEDACSALEITDRPAGVDHCSDREDLTDREFTLEEVDQRLQEIEQQLEQLMERQAALEQQWSQVTMLLDQIAGYGELGLPLGHLNQSAFLHFAVGSLPTRNLEQLREAAEGNVVLLPLQQREARQAVMALTSRKGRFALETALKQSGFRHEKPPVEEDADIGTLVDQSRGERTRLADELESVRAQRRQLAERSAAELAALERAVREEQAILGAQQHFPHTDNALLITGWVPAEQSNVVQGCLHGVCGERCVIRIEDPGDVPVDQIPVLLRPPRLLRPFITLVTGFGLPGYRDLEPTLLVAISYMLMFGIMFGDVGHGGLLTIAGIGAMLVGRQAKVQDYGLLVLMAGLSSIVFGVVYGSYFGIPALQQYALWHDPLHAPVRLMVATVGVGVVMISLGVILNMINLFRRGDFVTGVLDKFGLVGGIFYWGCLVFIVKYAALRELGLTSLLFVLAIALPLLAVTLKEPLQYALEKRAGHAPHSDSLMMACMESLIEAFEAVLSYLANTISFVRLAAYAMSHAAILMATFAVADAVLDIPAAGGVLYVAVVIGGNAVALLLEGVVVAVQVLRLEYYEFFSKFFPGTGVPFRPFSLLGREKETT